MEWISVEEQLPWDDITVLGINNQFKDVRPIFCYYDKEEGCFFSAETPDFYPIIITHWMMIPQLENE